MEGENIENSRIILPKYLPLNFKDENKREILSEEVIRLMIQTLEDLGLQQSAKTLQEESNVVFEDENVINFRKNIIEGNWSIVHDILPLLNIQNEISKNTVEFLLFEQQYLELLELRNFTEALSLLQTQLTPIATSLSAYYLQMESSIKLPISLPLTPPTPSSPTPLSPLSPVSPSNSKSLSDSKGFVNTLHHLSSLIMCRNSEELKEKAKWSGSAGSSRSDLITKLHEYVPPAMMIPQRRLGTLLMQAVSQQEYNCLYHNVKDYSVELLADHTCHQFILPKTNIVFTGHKDEVWFAQFSHNGKYLATASKDNSIIIWSVKPTSMGKIIHTLAVSGVTSYIDWSSDNSKLLSCTSKFIYVWDAITGSCINTFSNPNSKGDIQTIAWFPNNLSFVSGGRGQFITSHSLQGDEIRTWEASNIIDIIINRDASLMIATSHEMKIHIFDLHSSSSEVIQEIACITSISLSRDSRYLLASLVTREVHLWDIANKKLIQKYHGGFGKPYQYYIRSCFGGVNESFILSGSEESGVYVWNRHQGNLLTVLEGHTKMVNSVCWNYGSQNMFASVSDDCTVRIWIFDSSFPS